MDFDLHIDENETPKDMLNGMCIHFEVSGFSGEWKQRRIDRCRTGRSGNGRYNMEVLQEDRIMYRAGNVQNPYGRWFTSEDIMLCKLI